MHYSLPIDFVHFEKKIAVLNTLSVVESRVTWPKCNLPIQLYYKPTVPLSSLLCTIEWILIYCKKLIFLNSKFLKCELRFSVIIITSLLDSLCSKHRAPILKLMFICNVWDWEFIQAGVIKADHVFSHVYNSYEWFLMTSGFEMITGGKSTQFRFRDKSKTLFYSMHGIIAHLIAQNTEDTRKGIHIKINAHNRLLAS